MSMNTSCPNYRSKVLYVPVNFWDSFGCHGECFAPHKQKRVATSGGVVRDTPADNSVNFWSKTVTS